MCGKDLRLKYTFTCYLHQGIVWIGKLMAKRFEVEVVTSPCQCQYQGFSVLCPTTQTIYKIKTRNSNQKQAFKFL